MIIPGFGLSSNINVVLLVMETVQRFRVISKRHSIPTIKHMVLLLRMSINPLTVLPITLLR